MGAIAVFIFMFLSGYLCLKAQGQYSERLRTSCVFAVKRLTRLVLPLTFAVFFSALVIGAAFTTLPLFDYLSHPAMHDYLKNCVPFAMIRFHLPDVFAWNVHGINGSLWMIPALWWSYAIMTIAILLGVVRNRRVVLSLCLLVWGIWIARAWLSAFVPGPVWDAVWNAMHIRIVDSPRIIAIFLTGWTFALYDDEYEYSGWLALVFGALLFIWFHTDVCDLPLAVLGGYILAWAIHSRQIPYVDKFPPISFGIYLVAFPIQCACTHLFGGKMNPYLNFVLSMSVIVPIALLEYYLVEKPTFKIRKALLQKVDGLFCRKQRETNERN